GASVLRPRQRRNANAKASNSNTPGPAAPVEQPEPTADAATGVDPEPPLPPSLTPPVSPPEPPDGGGSDGSVSPAVGPGVPDTAVSASTADCSSASLSGNESVSPLSTAVIAAPEAASRTVICTSAPIPRVAFSRSRLDAAVLPLSRWTTKCRVPRSSRPYRSTSTRGSSERANVSGSHPAPPISI